MKFVYYLLIIFLSLFQARAAFCIDAGESPTDPGRTPGAGPLVPLVPTADGGGGGEDLFAEVRARVKAIIESRIAFNDALLEALRNPSSARYLACEELAGRGGSSSGGGGASLVISFRDVCTFNERNYQQLLRLLERARSGQDITLVHCVAQRLAEVLTSRDSLLQEFFESNDWAEKKYINRISDITSPHVDPKAADFVARHVRCQTIGGPLNLESNQFDLPPLLPLQGTKISAAMGGGRVAHLRSAYALRLRVIRALDMRCRTQFVEDAAAGGWNGGNKALCTSYSCCD